MSKFLKNVIFTVYIIIAVFVTICLLSYNEFRVTDFGNCALVIVSDNNLEPDYAKGDLIIINKNDEILTGEKAFFYDTYNRKIEVRLGNVIEREKVTDTEITYTFEGEKKVSSEYVLGTSTTTEVIPVAGTILGILESKWGFLFLIVLPALLAFLYQITVVVSELKDDGKGKENSNDEK